jgi:predicted nucleic acid-binding protein
VIILDTNVVSELMRHDANPAVQAWARRRRRRDLITTAVMGLRVGVENLLHSRRRSELDAALSHMLIDFFEGRVLRFDIPAAVAAARWHTARRRLGRAITTTDAQIAGIAIARNVPIATRNVADFEGISVKLINPWSGTD